MLPPCGKSYSTGPFTPPRAALTLRWLTQKAPITTSTTKLMAMILRSRNMDRPPVESDTEGRKGKFPGAEREQHWLRRAITGVFDPGGRWGRYRQAAEPGLGPLL